MGKRKKNTVIAIRVTPETADRIHEKAAAAGESLQNYVTDAALGCEIINLSELTAFTRELKRHGSNLNQLAVLAHTGQIQCADIGETAKLYADLLAAVGRIRERRRD